MHMSIIPKISIEFAACIMFHFIGSISATAVTNGIALMIFVYYTAKTSGAHLNPAVSITFMLLGYIDPIEMLFYWTAQICGCIIGGLWVALLIPGLTVGSEITHSGEGPFYDGCFVPADGLSYKDVFAFEAVCTFCFIVPIFSVVWYTLHKNGYGNTGPIIIGLSLMANAYVAGPFTGGALNPARVLGSAAVFNCPNNYILYYILGELLAGIMAVFAIIPGYGICPTSWYINYIPTELMNRWALNTSLRCNSQELQERLSSQTMHDIQSRILSTILQYPPSPGNKKPNNDHRSSFDQTKYNASIIYKSRTSLDDYKKTNNIVTDKSNRSSAPQLDIDLERGKV